LSYSSLRTLRVFIYRNDATSSRRGCIALFMDAIYLSVPDTPITDKLDFWILVVLISGGLELLFFWVCTIQSWLAMQVVPDVNEVGALR
jgi:hypothetical protein